MLEAERPVEGRDFDWPTSADEREVPVVLFVEVNSIDELVETFNKYPSVLPIRAFVLCMSVPSAVVKVVDGVSVAVYEKVLVAQEVFLC